MAGNDRVIAEMQEAIDQPDHNQSESAANSRRMHIATEAAAALAGAGVAAPTGRAVGVKKVIRRAVDASTTTGTQEQLNRQIAEALTAMRHLIDRFDLRLAALEANSTSTWSAISDLDNKPSENAALRASLASHDILIDELTKSLASVTEELESIATRVEANGSTGSSVGESLDSLRGALTKVAGTVETLRGDTALTRSHLDLLLADTRSPAGHPGRTAEEVARWRQSELYARFESRFRGTRDQVLASLEPYSDVVESLGSQGPVLDIGSGRGEWLGLLQSKGVLAYGVDTNSDFVEACRERGLDVRLEDALEHLTSIPEGSLGAVTGFHIVEHIPVETLVNLANLCMVAIAPGGRVLFETPNPTNLRVGAAAFYLDPTHLRPLHPDLLQFILTDCGFVDVEVRFLHPARDIPPSEDELQREFSWSLFGPQDYAVIATRPGAPVGS